MKFRQSLFWDTDPKLIDPQKHAVYIIERVLDFGNDKEVRWVCNFYRPALIKKVINNSRSLQALKIPVINPSYLPGRLSCIIKRRKGDDEAVKCPYLGTGKMGCTCNASVTRIAPSRYEMNRYCTTEAFYLCPMLLARLLRGGDQKKTAPARLVMRQVA